MTIAELTAADLRPVDLFDDLDDAALAPWAAAAEPYALSPGDVIVQPGEPAPGLIVLLDGRARTLLVDGLREEPLGHQEAPTWIGAIAALTGGELGVRMRCETDCRLARIPTDRFTELVLASPPVHRLIMQRISPVMTRLTTIESNRERLASLGTMAAGLAHELNNPAAAAKRAASDLVDALETVSGTIRAFVETGIERADAERLVQLHDEALERNRCELARPAWTRRTPRTRCSSASRTSACPRPGGSPSRSRAPVSTRSGWRRSRRSPGRRPAPRCAGSPPR